MNNKLIGIIGAMPEEIDGIVQLLNNKQEFTLGMRIYYRGEINGVPTVVVFSRWGKVAASITITTLIVEFKITELIFTGVAGAIHADLQIGDIVIGSRFIQHDMDARPLMKRFEIPLLGKLILECSNDKVELASERIRELLANKIPGAIDHATLTQFGITQPRLFIGDIASGDKFFGSHDDKQELLRLLPDVLCVEMEGAAVAQVCYEHGISFTIIRVISDTADDKAPIDFAQFIKKVSSIYSAKIIKKLYGL